MRSNEPGEDRSTLERVGARTEPWESQALQDVEKSDYHWSQGKRSNLLDMKRVEKAQNDKFQENKSVNEIRCSSRS